MTPEQLTEILKIVGWILTGGIGVAVINWLSTRGNLKAEKNIDLQNYWHKEFKRLEARIDELENDVRGRDVTIAELSKENEKLKCELEKADVKIERLTARIQELERLMRKFGIDPDNPKPPEVEKK